MRRTFLIILDVGFLSVATAFAFVLRENFDISLARLIDFGPYLVATIIASIVVFSISGVNRTIWRFSSAPDYLRVMSAVSAVVVGAVALTFAWNRLDGTARSLPFIQLIFGIAFLIGARAAHKIRHDARQHRKAFGAFLQPASPTPQITLLVLGISKLTEAYLQAVAELAPGRIRVAGLVGSTDRHVGRLVASHPVLGDTDELDSILDDLEVHGVTIDRIIVVSPFRSLCESDRETLLRIDRSRSIAVQFLVQDLGFNCDAVSKTGGIGRPQQPSSLAFQKVSFHITPETLEKIARRRYWRIKRLVDFSIALSAIVILSPFLLASAACVAASVGFPVLFWQQRPGLGSRPLRLYKFRTMKAAYAPDGRRLSDAERVSRLGSLMRRLRFDEFPQLFNVIRGDMAIIGPRPLLHWEQTEAQSARLLVRPGLTGWAQVVGGRTISSDDKAALDIWYVQHASLRLDIEIALRTVIMVIFGERVSKSDIEKAWCDLGESGIVHRSGAKISAVIGGFAAKAG
ncbi:sugar transferase [Rhodomicrobium sp. Az07]|uniref:sugar transferase n=1 Tax=Rhodomicrobium sp. Az07 TaxID=2839034 RepID=UPI001BE6E971|nr:sugar transferase [Rhodomicrobium sp. Az07]MBT3070328.1 sugar transferase [Rhodomicrobium sp. Az07]